MDKARSLPQRLEDIKESIALIKQCPVCNDTYKEELISIVEQTGRSSLIHITCSACHHGLVALIGNTQMGVGLVALITDLTREDVRCFKNIAPLSDDELLDCYDTIHNGHALTEQLGINK